MQSPLYIGITASESNYHNYPIWIKGDDAFIEIVRLSPETMGDFDKCSGVVFSGGVDSHPRFYNNPRIDYPNGPTQFDEQRDEFEIAIFKNAQSKGLPILGICRGMQLINVALGGSLIQDLEENSKSCHRRIDGVDGIHEINIEKDSFLYRISNEEKIQVNSAHHQGIGEVADILKVAATSKDGVAEALEKKDGTQSPFFLCVQWHPERFLQTHPDYILSQKIREQFINAAQTFRS